MERVQWTPVLNPPKDVLEMFEALGDNDQGVVMDSLVTHLRRAVASLRVANGDAEDVCEAVRQVGLEGAPFAEEMVQDTIDEMFEDPGKVKVGVVWVDEEGRTMVEDNRLEVKMRPLTAEVAKASGFEKLRNEWVDSLGRMNIGTPYTPSWAQPLDHVDCINTSGCKIQEGDLVYINDEGKPNTALSQPWGQINTEFSGDWSSVGEQVEKLRAEARGSGKPVVSSVQLDGKSGWESLPALRVTASIGNEADLEQGVVLFKDGVLRNFTGSTISAGKTVTIAEQPADSEGGLVTVTVDNQEVKAFTLMDDMHPNTLYHLHVELTKQPEWVEFNISFMNGKVVDDEADVGEVGKVEKPVVLKTFDDFAREFGTSGEAKVPEDALRAIAGEPRSFIKRVEPAPCPTCGEHLDSGKDVSPNTGELTCWKCGWPSC